MVEQSAWTKWWESPAGKITFYTTLTLCLLLLFGLKDLLVLQNNTWGHLYGVVNTPVLTWEEVVVYLPLANHASLETPFPAAPMADPTLNQFTNFPPITLLLQGLIFNGLFGGQIDTYLLALHTLLPTAAFWLLFLIYRRYVAESWAVLLAFWGVTFFRNFSSLGYWLDLLGGNGWVDGASLSPLELTRVPTPALSFLLFIATFYVTTRHIKPGRNTTLLYTLLWASQAYIYLFNFVAGMLFWTGFLAFLDYARDKRWVPGRVARTLLIHLTLAFAVVLPLLLRQTAFATPLDRELFQRMGLIVATAGPIVSEWGFFIAYIAPLLIVLLVAWISSADYYELLYRFAPVLLMIGVELVVLNLHLILGQFLQPYLFSVRIGNFFSRYLYFIPVIYFISQPRKTRFHRRSQLSQRLTPIYERITTTIVQSRQAIAFAGCVLIAVVVVASSLKYADNHAQQVAPRMVVVIEQLDELVMADVPPAGLIASENLAVNLLLPVQSNHEALLVSAFNNYVPSDEIMERLLLFAHLFNWSEDQFLAFMLPNERYDTFYSDNEFIVMPDVLENGFGYWLLHHRREMTPAELTDYETTLRQQFATFDVHTAATTYNLLAVQSSSPINPALPVARTAPAGEMTIYYLQP